MPVDDFRALIQFRLQGLARFDWAALAGRQE